MTPNNSISIEIPKNVIDSLRVLSPDRRQQVFDFVEFLSQKQENIADEHKVESVDIKKNRRQRLLGLHSGKGWVSDDFEEPLADEFWDEGTLV